MSRSRVSVVCVGILAGVLLGAVGDVSAQSFRRAGLHTDWNWVRLFCIESYLAH